MDVNFLFAGINLILSVAIVVLLIKLAFEQRGKTLASSLRFLAYGFIVFILHEAIIMLIELGQNDLKIFGILSETIFLIVLFAVIVYVIKPMIKAHSLLVKGEKREGKLEWKMKW